MTIKLVGPNCAHCFSSFSPAASVFLGREQPVSFGSYVTLKL